MTELICWPLDNKQYTSVALGAAYAARSRGVLNAEKRFVLIKEYFPVTLCNGRSASGALMPKEDKEVLFKTSRMDFKDLYDDLHNLTPATGLSTILDVMEENNTVYAVEESEKGMTLSHYLHLRSRTLTPAEARKYMEENQFAKGSMLPKVEACIEYVEAFPKGKALITSLECAAAGLEGKTGTVIVA